MEWKEQIPWFGIQSVHGYSKWKTELGSMIDLWLE